MKLSSFRYRGASRIGVHTDVGVIPLDTGGRSIRALLAEGTALDSLRTGDADKALPWSEVERLPVIPDPGKIVCVGTNYADHRSEAKRAPSDYPVLFSRFADTQIADGDPIVLPSSSDRVDYEGELALVIGQYCWQVPESAAMSFVAGYSCYNDVTVRDWQRHTHQWMPGKNFPGTGAFGPCLVTAQQVPDPGSLHLSTRVNGELRQSASVRDLIFSIPRLISYISSFTALSPGDVVVTGTPGGVGFFRDPPIFLQDGDVVDVDISGIGTLRNSVRSLTTDMS